MSAIIQGKGDVFGPIGAVAGNIPIFYGTSGKIIKDGGISSTALLPRGSIWGLTLSNNATDATNDVDVAVGQCSDSTGIVDIILVSSLTKRLDAAWASGTNQGGRDTGAIADAWWHVFVIKNPTTGVVDALFSLHPSAPTLPSGFTVFRRVGAVVRVTGVIASFLQFGDMFSASLVSVYGGTVARSLSLLTLTRCPLGVITFPILKCQIQLATSGAIRFEFAHGLDSSINTGAVAQQNPGGATNSQIMTTVSTNLSQQVYMAVLISGGTLTDSYIHHCGYYDNRGKDGYSP